MKAAFTLVPSESKRLIAKAIVQLDEVRTAWEKGYIILNGGTTNGYVAQELLGMKDLEPGRFSAGLNTHRLLCVTAPEERAIFPIVLFCGSRSSKTPVEALQDFRIETVIIKGANAIDREGNIGIITSGFDGGSFAATYGTATSQGVKCIFPVGLEKMVSSVKEGASWAGAKTFDYSMGADFGMYFVANGTLVTEIEALRVLAGVEARHVASGGVGDSAGGVVLIIKGDDSSVKRAISIVELIKGEPLPRGLKGICETCQYSCTFAGRHERDLPSWL